MLILKKRIYLWSMYVVYSSIKLERAEVEYYEAPLTNDPEVVMGY